MSFTYDAKRIWISNDGLGPRRNRFCAFAQPVAVAACYMILIIFVGGFYNFTKYCILIGCSLHTKSDIMQDDVNCPITLSWKR